MPSRRPVPDALPEGVVDDVVDRLLAAGCVAAEEEADELVAAAPDMATLESWLRRREQGEPLAWITGTMLFCDRVVRVDPGVYVPRYQSEELARRAATLLGTAAAMTAGVVARAVDLCTGTGAIAAHLQTAVPGAAVVGVDIDARAVACARSNGVRAVRADLDRPPFRPGAVDLVTAVAPYVPTAEMAFLPADVQRYEPRRALDGGDDGLDLVRRVVASAGRLLRSGGWLLVEIGADQDGPLAAPLTAAGFVRPNPWHDEDGDLRGLAARRT